MKSVFRWTSVLPLLLLLVLTLSASGCGKDKTDTTAVPQKSVLTVSPESVNVSISTDTIQNFTVTATYADGTPIPTAALTISGAFAVPRANARYQFYYYPDGVTPVSSSFTAQTDDFGVYKFSIKIYGPNNVFKDNIDISSGTAFVSVAVSST